MKEKIDPFRFRVSGNLIKELGEESISNPNVAIIELIKNAYDADAKKVKIEFVDISTSNAKIVISDNGDGMNYDNLQNRWMLIASPHKSEIKKTDMGRIPVGEKGIGRLASESLGNKTILVSRPKNETMGYEANFNWQEYRKENVLCNDVNNDAYKFKKAAKEQGIELTISELKESWNDSKKMRRFLKDIYILHPMNSLPKKFKVNIKTGLSHITLSEPTTKMLDSAVYKLKAKLMSKNIIEYSFYVGDKLHSSDTVKLDSDLECGDASFELYFFYRIAKAYEERLSKKLTRKELKEITDFLNEYSGIKLYRDGFRVKPYGEEGWDWMGIETAAQNNTMCPRNIQITGMVNISKLKNPRIVDTTTREGVIDTKEFNDLKKFVRTALIKIFIDKRSEVESEKKKARKTVTKKKDAKKKRVPVVKIPEVKKEEKELIDVKGDYPQSFYYELQQEINACYQTNYPNATFFLSRKLVENLIFNILEKKYPNEVALWYNTERGYHRPLSKLISNLYEKRGDFKPNSKKYIETFNTNVGLFRKEANAKVHNIFDYLGDKIELDRYKINDLIQLLLNIYHTIK